MGDDTKVIPERYQCEVCLNIYTTKEEAIECESKMPPVYPIGMIFATHCPGAMYSDMTMAIADQKTEKHWNASSLWVCRDNARGDSLGPHMSASFQRLNEYHSKINMDHPTFKRMVRHLRLYRIPITIWDGEKPVPYKGDDKCQP